MQEHLECVVSAIDSISYGDQVDMMVRRHQNWNLLPTQVESVFFLRFILFDDIRPTHYTRTILVATH